MNIIIKLRKTENLYIMREYKNFFKISRDITG